MKQTTIRKYTDILNAAKNSGKPFRSFCKDSGLNYNSITSAMRSLRKSDDANDLVTLYNDVVTERIDNDDRAETSIIRDQQNHIIEYHLTSYKRDKVPFKAILSREDMETLCGLYTYYGGNVTARIVANEFPKYTLPEVKRILRAFGITKDSFWTPQHLLEELSLEELTQYRMNIKERAAFKYADAQAERNYTNLIKKLAKENLDLKRSIADRQTYLENVTPNTEYYISKETSANEKVLILTLSDLHVGAYNTPYGFIDLADYNEEEIKNRLSKVLDFVYTNQYTRIIVLNLGDSVDSYKKETTRGGHLLPGSIDDRDMSKMFISVMTWFFGSMKQKIDDISYVCIGEANHKNI